MEDELVKITEYPIDKSIINASSKYQLKAEIFVYKKDYENAKNLLNNY